MAMTALKDITLNLDPNILEKLNSPNKALYIILTFIIKFAKLYFLTQLITSGLTLL